MPRPNKSIKWVFSSPLDIYLNFDDEVHRTTTNSLGYPLLTKMKDKGKSCTVILGNVHQEGLHYFSVNASDQVWTCKLNYRGNLQSLGVTNADRAITVIIHK